MYVKRNSKVDHDRVLPIINNAHLEDVHYCFPPSTGGWEEAAVETGPVGFDAQLSLPTWAGYVLGLEPLCPVWCLWTQLTIFSVVVITLKPLPPSQGGWNVPRCRTAGEEASSQSCVHLGQCNCSHQCVTSPEGVVVVESETDGDRMDRSVVRWTGEEGSNGRTMAQTIPDYVCIEHIVLSQIMTEQWQLVEHRCDTASPVP